jgi:hypothetical protein
MEKYKKIKTRKREILLLLREALSYEFRVARKYIKA